MDPRASIVVLSLVALAPGRVQGDEPSEVPFVLHEMGQAGKKLGQTSLVDIDRDGDLDFLSGQRGGDIWWWEFRAANDWQRHLLGTDSPTDVGGTAFDVDGDGWVDQCSGGAWYRNPGNPRQKAFQRFANGATATHDNRAADLDGDGKLDLVAMQDVRGVFWYKIPENPREAWPQVRVGDARHSGLAVGDLDGDGDQDLVVGNWWYENVDGRGERWKQHQNIPFGGVTYNAQGMATQNRLADLDADGDLDLAITDGETKGAQAAWIENADGRGGRWQRHDLVADCGALHSLAIADFNNDQRPDIFTCEMEIGGQGRWFLFLNSGQRSFRQQIILQGVPGHESVAGDVDQDGDIDLCSKPWNSGRHVYLENRLLGATRSGQR